MRRRLIPALALGLTALLAGCGTDTDSPAGAAPSPSLTASSAAVDPVAAITGSLARSVREPVRMDVTMGVGGQSLRLEAAVDPATEEMTVEMSGPESFTLIVSKDAVYLKDETEDDAWMKLDRARLKPGGPLSQGLDIESQAGILGGVVSAQSAGDGRYTGIADLHKAAAAAGSDDQRESLESIAKLVKQPSAVPFEASIDAEGRLTALSYTVDMPTGSMKTEMTLHSFGEPVTITPPPASQTEDAPDSSYAFF
ncbi:hypothetical protein [Micromonospora sp. NPDC049799]|uniref:hypothetical protein n=1 Tax=Micromonospora sp. NPDC049799 TaxID=3154741 RepID=UPI0033D0E048